MNQKKRMMTMSKSQIISQFQQALRILESAWDNLDDYLEKTNQRFMGSSVADAIEGTERTIMNLNKLK